MKSHHVRKTFLKNVFLPSLAHALESLHSATVCASSQSQDCVDSIFKESVSAKTFKSARLKSSFWLSSQAVMEYFLIFPSDENAGPLNMKQASLMLKQRSFLKVNCLINIQIVPSTHYKFAICLIYAQSGKAINIMLKADSWNYCCCFSSAYATVCSNLLPTELLCPSTSGLIL